MTKYNFLFFLGTIARAPENKTGSQPSNPTYIITMMCAHNLHMFGFLLNRF